MRLDELVLRMPGDEVRVPFHPQMTVLAGVGLLERQAVADSIVDAMAGTVDSASLRYTDATGCQIQDVPPIRALGVDADELRALVLIRPGDLGEIATNGRPDEDPDLVEARATMTAVAAELQAAMGARLEHDHLVQALQQVERDLRAAEEGEARRQYAKVLADLERVRAEAAALHGGDEGADTDRQLLSAAADTQELASRWRAAVRRLNELRLRTDHIERLDPAALASAVQIPDALPVDLRRVVAHVESARRDRDAIEAQLRQHAASTLPAPSDPRVVDLATADQSVVWATRDRVLLAVHSTERERMALGGTGSVDQPGGSAVVDRLEQAHSEVEAAEREVEERRRQTMMTGAALGVAGVGAAVAVAPILGLLLVGGAAIAVCMRLGKPARQLAAARKTEQELLEHAGAPSYLAFHLRRVDASVIPGAHQRLEATAREHKAALQAWSAIMPRTSVEQAVALEAEARAYARSLLELGDKAGEIEELRRTLSEQAEPAYEAACAQLAQMLRPFQLAIEPGVRFEEIEAGLRGQVEVGRDARMQAELEEAEATEQKLAARLDELLSHVGFDEGSVEARAGALDWAIDRAREREEARTRARSQEEIDNDIARLSEEVGRMRRPEWATVQAAEANLPDADELRRRHEELRAKVAAARQTDADVERLADRHSAMERRVTALEAKHDGARADAALAQVADVQERLLARLTQAGHVGSMNESVPVVLDDAFLRIPAERKWELLDLLRRIADHTQIVYLTDDPFVGAWARRRAGAGSITLLEPVDA